MSDAAVLRELRRLNARLDALDRKPEKRVRQPRNLRIPTAQDVDALAAAARTLDLPEWERERFANSILVSAYSGVRRCELLALTTRMVSGGGVAPMMLTVPPFKGARRPRLVVVFGPGRRALVASCSGVGRMFAWPERRHRYLFEQARKLAGLRDVGTHGLRHFCATWLLDQGKSAEDVAWQLHGHPDPRLIVEVYGHPSRELALERLAT